MGRVSKESLLVEGLATFLILFGLSSHEQPSVAQAALTALNNPRESFFYQTIPPATDTPTPPPEEPTETPTPTEMASPTPTATATATYTPEGPTPTPAEPAVSGISVHVFDGSLQPIEGLPVYVQQELHAGTATLHTNVIGNTSTLVENGQTVTVSTQGPNAVQEALYFLETDGASFEQVTVSHDEGANLSSSVTLHTGDQAAQASSLRMSAEEPTPPPEEPTETPTPTEMASPTPTATATYTPEGPTPTPSPETNLFAPNLFIGGVVMPNEISVDSSPDGTKIQATDFESVGSITLNRADLIQTAEFVASTENSAPGNYDVTVYAAAPDTDGFTLSVTTDGSTATANIEPGIFSSGSLNLNTAEVAEAIANGQENQAQLPISVDTDNNGAPEKDITVPAEVTKTERFNVYLPSVQR